MIIVAGCVIVKKDKILMVQEAQKKCYGQWNMPAGHVDSFEKITEAAIREVNEETGCKVKLTGVLPIETVYMPNGETLIHVRFTADLLEENIKFDTDEILDVQWLNIQEVKNMKDKELRASDVNVKFIENYENNKIYPLDIFDNNVYVRKQI